MISTISFELDLSGSYPIYIPKASSLGGLKRLVRPNQARLFEPANQCRYCGTFWGSNHDAHGRACLTSTCLACGAVVCQGEGLGQGTCPVCYRGWLTNWHHGYDQKCGYKNCNEEAVADQARVGRACKKHLKDLNPNFEGWVEVD